MKMQIDKNHNIVLHYIDAMMPLQFVEFSTRNRNLKNIQEL